MFRRIDDRQTATTIADNDMPIAAVDPDIVGIVAKAEFRHFMAIGCGIEMDGSIAASDDDLVKLIEIGDTLRFVQFYNPAELATTGQINLIDSAVAIFRDEQSAMSHVERKMVDPAGDVGQ